MSNLAAARVWVVGHGFLGQALANACRAHGAAVLTIDPVSPADVCGAACHGATLATAYALCEPTLIFCCMATRGGTAVQYRTCYSDTVSALHRQCPGAKVIFCSSISVYGDCGRQLVTEKTTPRAAGERACVLLDAEQNVLAHGGVVARLAALYGEQRCELRRRHLAGEPQLPGAPDRLLHYVHVQDAVAALLLISQHPCGVYNVCGDCFTKASAYAALARETGVPISAEVSAASCRGGVNACVTADKLLALGWVPRPFFS